GHGAAAARDDGGAAGQSLDGHETEGLRPVDGEDEGAGSTQEPWLVVVVDLPDVVHERMTEQWLDFSLEIHAIHGVDLGRHLERDAEALGERDGQIGTLLGRDAPEKSEIVTSARRVRVLFEREAMIDRAHPVHAQPLEGMALSMADGHEGLIPEM